MTEFVKFYFGQILALSCALVWSQSVILFKKSGERFQPLALNLFKNVLAVVRLVPTIWTVGGQLAPRLPLTNCGILFISGSLGIELPGGTTSAGHKKTGRTATLAPQ